HLGILIMTGQAGAANPEKAAEMFRKSAQQGNAGGLHSLAIAYFQGTGVPQDLVVAYALFALAEHRGNAQAASAKDQVAPQLSPDQRSQAEALAAKWTPGQPLP